MISLLLCGLPGVSLQTGNSFCQGYLQTDGYVAYDDFDKREGITLLHCMAHARRKFSDALGSDKERAEYALSLLRQLYAIERRIKQEGLHAGS